MDAFEAASAAKQFIAKIFADEGPFDIGLEEINNTAQGYSVVISFSRKWDQFGGAIVNIVKPSRITKEVIISGDGDLIAIKNKIPF